jgi:hypothetical protein
MVLNPADTPKMVPVISIVATVVVLLLQVPPGVASVRIADVPTQTEAEPVIGAGDCAKAVTHSRSAIRVRCSCFIK